MQTNQELLNKMMQQELLKLKRMCFKYKHDTPFIRKDIIIESGDLSESKIMGNVVAGTYTKMKGKHNYDFSHKITINKLYVDQYANCKPNPNYYYELGKRFYLNKIKTVIRHELVHAFIEEHYGIWTDMQGVSNDSSPIFLSVLFYLNGYSSYDFVTVFKKSDMFQKIKSFKTFNELDAYLSHLLIDYQQITRKHKTGHLVDRNYITNSFVFGAYNAGLDNYYQSKIEYLVKTKMDLKVLETNVFKIGCSIMPDQIDRLVNKKRYGKFEKSEYQKIGVINGESIKTLYKETIGM
jgi:hypothetical protein